IERETFPAMVAGGSLFGLHDDCYWIDAGTPETYLQSQLDLIDGVRGGSEAAVAPDARVDDAASVDHSVVMGGAHVQGDAKVVDSVLLPGSVVEPGAQVLGSIVGTGVVVGRGATLTDLSVIGEGTVEPGAQLSGARLPDPD
ncbi:MAG TPA: NDP-sugar synthase, partial [Acidimicrobiales bacterium]|nr:NDP-sugar synthase [Acidimicrobiales bacterium]